MNCTNCGTDNPAGQRFCDSCGNALAAACPSCGQANRSDARFCGSCGTRFGAVEAAPVATAGPTGARGAPPTVAERRLVSVMFADLVGFTPFAEERDPEHVREVLERYFEAARTVIERHGGTIEKFIGDAVMAVWGTPIAHEDDAERAVRAALALLPAIRQVDASLEGRAAVATGEAAVNLGAADQALVAGDLVNTSARLQAAASPGTVLVTEAAMRAAGAAVMFEAADAQALKGKSANVAAWRAVRVLGDRAGRRRADSLEPPFVGRDGELTLLKDLLHASTREQRARLVAVVGPAGIGKTRLAWELEKYLYGLVEDIYWHRGRSPSYGEGVSYWALGEMVRRRCGLAEDDDEPTTRARVRETVEQFVAADEDRRWVEPALLALLGIDDPPPGGRDVLFAAWRIFFERIAARGTTVLLFEDLQFADTGLLDFIDHLLEWSRSSPIVVLALTRPELFERRPGFGSGARNFHSIPLEPLSDAQMTELLAGLVPGLPSAAADVIVGRADGIPLYAVETVRMLIADGRLEAVDEHTFRPIGELGKLAIPDSLRSLIASRLDALPAEERELIQHAAVLGQTFTDHALAAISPLDAQRREELLRALRQHDILTVQSDPRSPDRGHYAFVQGLIREVAYSTLARRARRERHLAVARYLESLDDEEIAGALASHYLAAYRASDPGPESEAVAIVARLALGGAAERATSLGSHDQALAYLEQALEVAADPAEGADLRLRAALAANAAGRYEPAEAFARAAMAAHEGLGHAGQAAQSGAVLGTILIDAHRPGEAVAVLEQAAGALDLGSRMRADIEARLSRAHMRSGQLELAVAAAERALPIAEAEQMTDVVAEALLNKGTALGQLGRSLEGVALLEAAVRLAQQASVPTTHLRALNNLASTLFVDDPLAASAIYREGFDLAQRLGQRGYVNFLAPNIAGDGWFRGDDWDAALAMLAETYEGAQSDVDRGTQLLASMDLHALRGKVDPVAFDEIDRMIGDSDDPSLRARVEWSRALAAFADGNGQAAVEHAQRAVDIDARSGPAVQILGMFAIWRGDPKAIRRAHEAVAAVERLGRLGNATRQHAAGAVAALEGRQRDALAGFLASIKSLFEMGGEFAAAQSIVSALAALPGEPELVALAPRAREVFERVGAQPFLRWLDQALAASPPSVAATATGPVGTADSPVSAG